VIVELAMGEPTLPGVTEEVLEEASQMRLGRWHLWDWEDIRRASGLEYLLRLTVFKCPLFASMVHWFLGDDDTCLHDHPSPFVSLIVRGGYYEDVPQCPETYRAGDPLVRTWYPPGSLLVRPAHWVHRVVLSRDSRGRPVPATTVLFMGTKVRRWGFWTQFGWIFYRDYDGARHCT